MNPSTTSTLRVNFFYSLRGKLILFFLGVALIPLLVVGIVAFLQAQNALQTEAINKLVAVRDIKAGQIENYFAERLGDVTVLAENPATIAAVRDIGGAVDAEAQAQGVSVAEVMGNYRSLYLKNPGLTNAGDGSPYSVAHAQHHAMFQNYVATYGYYDVFLVDAHEGAVIYTLTKEDDYGTSLKTGAYANSSLAEAFNLTLALGRGQALLEDFAYYAPSQAPAAFVASPVYDGPDLIGTLVLQVPIEQIDAIMQERSGMGETGESYLVGSDNLMRSNSRFSEDSTILQTEIKTVAATQALAGETNAEVLPDYRGVSVLSAYAPLEIAGSQWAILAEIDEAEAFAAVQSMMIMMLAILGVSVVGVVVVAFFVSNSIAQPVIAVTRTARLLAEGDLTDTVTVQGRDEIGLMADAFRNMISYQQSMAEAAHKLAQGDLAANVTPLSNRDMLGNAFSQMIVSLRDALRQVADNAGNLGSASEQLAASANQAGQATGQIATTIQQIAKGTQQQSEAVTKTAGSIEQMKRSIDGVARGAQEQATAMGKASAITSQISAAIGQVAQNAQAVSQDSAGAAETARAGARTVADTIKGMDAIKAKVGASAQKVQELGQRSDQIGVIVETIDDIAAQTNLLALNAAIEAARAGEHGKGFAVVADEVRKLAERASSSTKEIAGLIKGIQQTVSEAVRSMEAGAEEVEVGTARANEAGQALQDILKAAEAVNRQAEAARSASQQMSLLANELVASTDSVSAVIEENTASTEEMAAGSSDVTVAIENIASVSEENSASVEEVSASAEEMSAQVEEVTAAAQSLADMAQALQQVVSQFKLSATGSAGQNYPATPAPRASTRPVAPVKSGAGNGYRVETIHHN